MSKSFLEEQVENLRKATGAKLLCLWRKESQLSQFALFLAVLDMLAEEVGESKIDGMMRIIGMLEEKQAEDKRKRGVKKILAKIFIKGAV